MGAIGSSGIAWSGAPSVIHSPTVRNASRSRLIYILLISARSISTPGLTQIKSRRPWIASCDKDEIAARLGRLGSCGSVELRDRCGGAGRAVGLDGAVVDLSPDLLGDRGGDLRWAVDL